MLFADHPLLSYENRKTWSTQAADSDEKETAVQLEPQCKWGMPSPHILGQNWEERGIFTWHGSQSFSAKKSSTGLEMAPFGYKIIRTSGGPAILDGEGNASSTVLVERGRAVMRQLASRSGKPPFWPPLFIYKMEPDILWRCGRGRAGARVTFLIPCSRLAPQLVGTPMLVGGLFLKGFWTPASMNIISVVLGSCAKDGSTPDLHPFQCIRSSKHAQILVNAISNPPFHRVLNCNTEFIVCILR